MAHGMTRRVFAAAGAASVAALGLGARAQGADLKTLRCIMRNDLRVLDPMWTTAYVTRNHGYMVFDTLFALDAKFKQQPQMVGDYTISPDKLVYRFTLRDGLKFHDGHQRCDIISGRSLRAAGICATVTSASHSAIESRWCPSAPARHYSGWPIQPSAGAGERKRNRP